MSNRRGFTIIEIMIAIVILTMGILALVSTSALVTRLIARGQRSAMAGTFAASRLEKLRITACTAGRANGSDTLYRGSTWVAANTWTFTTLSGSTYRILLTTKYKTVKNRTRTDSLETEVLC